MAAWPIPVLHPAHQQVNLTVLNEADPIRYNTVQGTKMQSVVEERRYHIITSIIALTSEDCRMKASVRFRRNVNFSFCEIFFRPVRKGVGLIPSSYTQKSEYNHDNLLQQLPSSTWRHYRSKLKVREDFNQMRNGSTDGVHIFPVITAWHNIYIPNSEDILHT